MTRPARPDRRLKLLGEQFVRETMWFSAGDYPPSLSDRARADLLEHVLDIIRRATALPAKTRKERVVKAVMLRWLVQMEAEPGPVRDMVLSVCKDLGVE